jgi:phosphatidylglycerol:prolipoprotein diacylglycerol transferase
MIPWFDLRLPALGPITMHVFGILVAIGIAVGARVTRWRSQQLGLPAHAIQQMTMLVVIAGFIGAHLFDVFAYQASEHPITWAMLLNPLAGLSSFGGFAGALIALVAWSCVHRRPVGPWADALAAGLAPGWLFGRLGCFTAHDHPGLHTDFFLGVHYPDGVRHDLGLYEALFALAVTALFALLARRPRRAGTYTAILALAYAPVRFALDFLRADDLADADARYLGLTPAQYGCVLVFVAGLLVTSSLSAPAATSETA